MKDNGELYAYLKNIIDSVADPIFVKDRQHRWIDGNLAWEKIMNWPREKLLGKSDYDYFPKDEADVFWQKDEEVFTTQKENINIENFTDSKGVTHILSTKKNCFVGPNGDLILVGIIRDITELTKTQEKLKQSDEARFKALMDYSGCVVYIKDTEGRHLQVNNVLLGLLNMKEEDIIGKKDVDVYPPEYSKSYRSNDLEVLKAGKALTFEEHSNASGEERIYTTVKFPIFNSNGEIYAIGGISTDITERKHNEEKIENMVDELKSANTELERFAYVCSHDLQEPLRTINSFTQLLEKHLEGQVDEKAAHYIQFITEGSTRARDLINDVLQYSRSGIKIEQKKKVDMENVLEAIKSNLDVRLKEVNAEVTNTPLPLITANKTQMIQLLQNLIQNAIKFCSNIHPKVSISATKNNDMWEFAVKDNGIGIKPEYQQRIFEIFQRLHKRSEYPGTGVGLAICKKIVEGHNGQIWVESKLGEGATFYFTIPASDTDEIYPLKTI